MSLPLQPNWRRDYTSFTVTSSVYKQRIAGTAFRFFSEARIYMDGVLYFRYTDYGRKFLGFGN